MGIGWDLKLIEESKKPLSASQHSVTTKSQKETSNLSLSSYLLYDMRNKLFEGRFNILTNHVRIVINIHVET